MKKRIWNLGLALLLALALLSGCGGGSAMTESASVAYDTATEDVAVEEYGYDAKLEAEVTMDTADAGSGGEMVWEDGAKIIYTGNMEMETMEFDQAAQGLEDLVAACGGYVESSSMHNRSSGYRYADYTIRVPAERYKEFWEQAGSLCHVTWKNQEVRNISEAYYDTEGRLKTQQTKLERLQSLLAKAETMEDIITIESAISETEYMIESLSGQLRYYDAQVSYSTVSISLSEVYRLSGTEEPVNTFGERLGGALSSGWQDFLDGMEDFAVGLAYSWMWVLALIVVVVLAVSGLRRRKRKKETLKKSQEEQQP